ncbi:MAG: hypothetical protein LBD49_00550, partial [Oscillospiraceae bacterium]|nr:hypothetical protein [Oscillospiraceae bacterium]
TWTQNGKFLVGEYLAETVIDEFVTEKKWSGGDLALAYEWDDFVEVWINGVEYQLPSSSSFNVTGIGYVTETSPAIKRGSTVSIFPEIGLKVQLFDSGEVYEDTSIKKYAVDNGKIGKIVITYEHLAEVTKVDSARGTIDLKFWHYADPTAAAAATITTYEITDYPTDETFALKDYVVVTLQEGYTRGYPGSYWDDSNQNNTVDSGEIKYDGTILAAAVLRVAPVEQVSVKAASYTRGVNAGSSTSNYKTTLATLTTDTSDKYIFDSFYRFGVGDTPNFDGSALLILDSNGRVIGFTGDVAGPAALKYVYVEDIEVPQYSLGTPRVRASAYYPLTGETKVIDLPVKYKDANTGYVVTINSVDLAVASIDVGNQYLVSQGTSCKGLLGWYWYTSADDASTITLRSSLTGNEGVLGTKAGSIKTVPGDDTVYGVGTITAGSFFVRTNPIEAGFSVAGNAFGPIYTDSKTLFYYRGVKYTGYTAFPWNASTAAGGSALAVRGSDKIIDALFIYKGENIDAALTTFAIIKAMPYDWVTNDSKIDYTVVGSTAAITNAGVYELTDTQIPTYSIGDIVLVKQTSEGWEIDDYISANNTYTDGKYIVDFSHPDYEYFTVPDATVKAAIWTNSIPYLDGVAALDNQSGGTLKPKTKPDIGDEVRIIIGTPVGAFSPAALAVVIVKYSDQVKQDAAAAYAAAAGGTTDSNTWVISNIGTPGLSDVIIDVAIGGTPISATGSFSWSSSGAQITAVIKNDVTYGGGYFATQGNIKQIVTNNSAIRVVVNSVNAYDGDSNSTLDDDGDEKIDIGVTITDTVNGSSKTITISLRGMNISA